MSNLTNNTAELRDILAAVNALPEAGSSGGNNGSNTPVLKELTAEVNGTYQASDEGADGYSVVTVNVPSEEPVLQEGSATPTKSQQTVEPPSGVDGFSKFVVNKIPDNYIIPSGTKDITANGSGIDVSSYSEVNVNVPTSGGSSDTAIEDAFVTRRLTSYHNDRVTEIGPCAFRYCNVLSSASFPNATSVGDSAFYGCVSLTSINLPKVTEIESQAFSSCPSLQRVELPALQSIAAFALAHDSNLKTLILRSTNVVTLDAKSALTNTAIASGSGYVYVPRSLVDAYKAASNWSDYAAQFRAIEDYPDIVGG